MGILPQYGLSFYTIFTRLSMYIFASDAFCIVFFLFIDKIYEGTAVRQFPLLSLSAKTAPLLRGGC